MADEKPKKAPPAAAPGKIKALFDKAMAVKMPGGIPLPVFLGVFLGVFIIGTTVMAYVGLNRIDRARRQHMPARQPMADDKGKGRPAGHAAAAGSPTSKHSAAPGGRSPQAAAASGGEMDNKVVNFLLHSYEEQKAQISLQDDKITRLEGALAAMEKKMALPAPVSAVPAPGAPAAARQSAPAAVPSAAPVKAPPSSTAKKAGQSVAGMSDIKRLAELYTQMKPVDVSAIVEDLDDDILIRVFARMKPRTVAKILSLMDPERAARLSRKIAT